MKRASTHPAQIVDGYRGDVGHRQGLEAGDRRELGDAVAAWGSTPCTPAGPSGYGATSVTMYIGRRGIASSVPALTAVAAPVK